MTEGTTNGADATISTSARTGRYRWAIGGMLIATFVGHTSKVAGSYGPIFAVAGNACPVALPALHALSPRLAPTMAGALPATENPK